MTLYVVTIPHPKDPRRDVRVRECDSRAEAEATVDNLRRDRIVAYVREVPRP